jgi:hypothetical protein
MEGKTIMGHKCILNLFKQLSFTNYKGRWFLQLKHSNLPKIILAAHYFS